MADLSHRKAEIRVQITDTNGKALPNTKIKYNLKKHEFLFGYGAFDFLSYVMAPDDKKAFFKDRIDKWTAIFNYGTLPFYWGQFEKEEGHPNTEGLKKAAELMKSYNATIKGHPLCWHTVCAPWLLKYDNKTILEKQLARIQREVSDFKGLVDMWDVINEVVIMPIFDRYDNAVTRISKDLGRVGMVKTMFNQAYKYNPDGTFLINDFNLSSSYEILIDGCLQAGVPISAIGLQTHQHQGYLGRERFEDILSRFEHFGLPIHFTENTLVSGPNIPPEIRDLNDWHYEDNSSTPEFEERQKNQMEEMYRILFEEHPLVQAITGWDFTDGMWLNAPSGILHKDGSIKPAYTMLKNLIKDEWHSEGEAVTDEKGFVTISGFKGEYDISAGGKSAVIKVSDKNPTESCRLSI